MTRKKQKKREGDFVKIDLKDGTNCFGRVLENPNMAFYDLRVESIPGLSEIASSQILFKLWVMNYAITSGHWTILGNLPLEADLSQPITYFKQDPISGELSLYSDGEDETPATKEECEGLECAAVWDPEHVEDRLRDHYAGVPNEWVESLRIR